MWIQRTLTESPKCIKRRPNWQLACEWDDRDRIRFQEKVVGQEWNLLELDFSKGLGDAATVRELLVTEHDETGGTLSPNRKWYAYVSKETGRREVFVRRYAESGPLGPKIPIRAGTEPVWSKDSKELFFRLNRGVYAARISDADGRPEAPPEKLFEGDFVPGFNDMPFYDVAADGQRFVFVEGDFGFTKGRLEIHLNFRAELEKALPK